MQLKEAFLLVVSIEDLRFLCFRLAIVLAGLLLCNCPLAAQNAYDLGMASLRQGHLNEARAYFEKAVAVTPSSADAWKALGLTILRMNDYSAAANPLHHACDLAPSGDDACYLEGKTLFVLARYEESSAQLLKARKNARPEDLGKIDRALALTFEKLGQADESEARFKQAIARHRPGETVREDPRIDFGAFLVRQGRDTEAIPPLEQALASRPDSIPANVELGRAFLDLDHPDQALPFLRKAVALDPSAWNTRMLLGKAYLRVGQTEEGERELQAGREGWTKANHGSSIVQ